MEANFRKTIKIPIKRDGRSKTDINIKEQKAAEMTTKTKIVTVSHDATKHFSLNYDVLGLFPLEVKFSQKEMVLWITIIEMDMLFVIHYYHEQNPKRNKKFR